MNITRRQFTILMVGTLLVTCKKKDDEPAPSPAPPITSVTDVDNNVYPVVRIGDQFWMAENLKVAHFRNGEDIPNIAGGSGWAGTTSGIFCWYDNDSGNEALYGKLYSGNAPFDQRGLCPNGWHVPTEDEVTTLRDHLAGSSVAGGKLKATGTIQDGTGLWNAPNLGATNETGFDAVPSGYLYTIGGEFEGQGDQTRYWTSTEANANGAIYFSLRRENAALTISDDFRTVGNCVRCVLDQ